MKDFRSPKLVPTLDIKSDLQKLAGAAQSLNHLTDELTAQVEQIEAALSPLNLGLRVFVVAEASHDDNQQWTHYVRLLYDKVGGRWGLAIDEFDEYGPDPDSMSNHQSWSFKDAPRTLRLKVIDCIPVLLKALIKEVDLITGEVATKVAQAMDLVASLHDSPNEGSGK